MTRLNGFITTILFSLSFQLYAADSFQLPLDVYINNLHRGQLSCIIPSEVFVVQSVIKDEFLDLLEDYISEDLYAIYAAHQEITLDMKTIRDAGVIINIDYEMLSMVIEVPAQLRRLEKLSIIPNYEQYTEDAIAPSNVSGYINTYINQDVSSNNTETINYQAKANLDSSIHFYGFVLDTDVYINTANGIDLPDISLIHDLEHFRITAGNHSPSIRGFQKSGAYQGLLINSRNDFDKQNNSDIEFIIDEETSAKIILNGRHLRNIQLAPGKYKLKDFPFYSGLNKIDIILTSKTHGTREYSFYLPQDAAAIPAGQLEYSLSGGITEWDPQGFHSSADINYGIHDSFNLGANLQITESDATLGASFIWLTPIGNLNFNAAAWHSSQTLFSNQNFVPDYAGNIGYRYINNENALIPVIGWNVTFLGASFQSNADALQTESAIYLTQKMGRRFQLTSALNYRTFYDAADKLIGDFRFNYALSPGASISGGVTMSLIDPSFSTTSASLLFQFRDQKTNSSINYNQNLMTARSRIDWQTNLPKERIDLSASWEGPSINDDYNYGVETAAKYVHDRFTSSLQLSALESVNGLSFQGNHSVAFAIAMANGYLSFGRPISDSFALVIPRYSLSGEDMGVNFDGQNYEAIGDGFGPALIGSLSSYRTQLVNIELLNPASDIFIKEDSFYVNPSYKSGTVLFVGSRPEVLLVANITNKNEKPIALKLGSMKATKDESSSQFFTDENGLAYIYGLQAGEYILSLPGFEEFILTIDDNNESEIFRDIQLHSSQGSSQGDTP